MNGLPYRRSITVDNNGFYLGGGGNNNLREASQLFDIGGPIVNPWINSWTQPLPRSGIVASILPAQVPSAGHTQNLAAAPRGSATYNLNFSPQPNYDQASSAPTVNFRQTPFGFSQLSMPEIEKTPAIQQYQQIPPELLQAQAATPKFQSRQDPFGFSKLSLPSTDPSFNVQAQLMQQQQQQMQAPVASHVFQSRQNPYGFAKLSFPSGY